MADLNIDASSKENTANKQNDLSPDGTGIKFPTVDAINESVVKKSELPSNLTLYPTNVPSSIAGYSLMVTDIEDPNYNTIAANVPTGAITATGQLIASLATTDGQLTGNPGEINVTTIGNIRRISGSGEATFYYEIYLRTGAGIETLIGTSSNTLPVNLSLYTEFQASALFNNGIWKATDKIVIKYYANRIAGGSNPSYEFQFGGALPVRTIVPVPASIIVDLPITIGSTSVNGGTDGKLLNVTAGKVGEVTPSKTLVGLSNVDNTSDLNKPISTATQTALNTKLDKIIQVTGVSITVASWVLVAGFYESNISNANITALTVVDVIPSNSSIDVISSASLLPLTSSSSGIVKIYSRSVPSADIIVTLNIFK